MGVRRIKDLNLALIGKWCWRLFADQGGSWFKVTRSKYAIDGGRVKRRGRKALMRV